MDEAINLCANIIPIIVSIVLVFCRFKPTLKGVLAWLNQMNSVLFVTIILALLFFGLILGLIIDCIRHLLEDGLIKYRSRLRQLQQVLNLLPKYCRFHNLDMHSLIAMFYLESPPSTRAILERQYAWTEFYGNVMFALVIVALGCLHIWGVFAFQAVILIVLIVLVVFYMYYMCLVNYYMRNYMVIRGTYETKRGIVQDHDFYKKMIEKSDI